MGVIAGVWRKDGRPDAASACGEVLDALCLWAQGNSHIWQSDSIAFGTRNGDGCLDAAESACVVWDGRLDNGDEIARDLGLPPSFALKLSPVEFAHRAITRWGDAGIGRLIGDFALARWCGERKTLTLARSACGFQPLFFHDGPYVAGFASMPRGLHALPEVPIEIDEDKIAERLLFQLSSGDNSCFKHIRRVEPGSIAVIALGGTAQRRFWYPENVTPLRLRDAAEYEEGLRAHIDEAVRCHLAGRSETGTQLSGGRDSTVVTATAARLLAPTGGRVAAFTAAPRIGYHGFSKPDRFGDETAHAAAVAALHQNIDHTILRTDETVAALEELDRAFRYYQQPAGDVPNMSWVHRIYAQAQRRGLATMLIAVYGNLSISYSGDGLLAGLLRQGRLVRAWREGRALVRSRAKRPLSVAAMTVRPFLPRWMWTGFWRSKALERERALSVAAIHPDLLTRILDGRTSLQPNLVNRPGLNSIVARAIPLIGGDTGHLTKGARAIWGLDLSDPTADRRVVEFCMAVPEEYYLRDGRRAALMRGAFADRLPPLVLNEEQRGYQSADWHETLVRSRASLFLELERLQQSEIAGRILDLPRMRNLIETMPSGDWHEPATTYRYRTLLLNAFAFGHFLRNATGGS